MSGRVSVAVLAVVFGVLHGWATFQGVSNLIALPAFYDGSGLGQYTPWALLIAGVLIPPLAFTAALVLGRGRVPSHRVALFAVALATSNALVLSAGALAPILLAFQAGA